MSEANSRFLRLKRLRIMSRGRAVYNETFHEGVNIIRGLNGSGKSTISDFIFFVLGGEFDDWKEAARRCDEVQAEIETTEGTMSIRRLTASKASNVSVFFGSLLKASENLLESWESYPLHRSTNRNSFSQLIFQMVGIPEAMGEGSSNITIHQILRLCYSDQRTPASRIFRFESFDTQNIREALGGLIFGIGGYEIYETELQIRALTKELSEVSVKLSGLLKAMPPDKALQTTQALYSNISDLNIEKEGLRKSINEIDEVVDTGEVRKFLKGRNSLLNEVKNSLRKLESTENVIAKVQLELTEIAQYQQHISESLDRLRKAENTLLIIGDIEFSHCPACGVALKPSNDENHCVVCHSPKDINVEKTRYSQIRMDFELQARESKQLFALNNSKLSEAKNELRVLRNEYEKQYSNFQVQYSESNSPREAALAKITIRIGFIDGEVKHLTDYLNIASELERMQIKKNTIQVKLESVSQKNKLLKRSVENRRNKAMLKFSSIASSLLHADFKRQEEFENAEKVELNFTNDAISVDGKLNFAESSNVFLKNSAILSILLASAEDREFIHPSFLLLDNIEDKGMEMSRSHLFQELIVKRATEMEIPFQVIFTTSMMNPKLELEDYVIGPAYTDELRSLDFSNPSTVETN